MKWITPTGVRSDNIRQKQLLSIMAPTLLLTSCSQPSASPTPTAEAEKLFHLVA